MLKKILAVLAVSLICALASAEDSILEIIPVNYRTAEDILPLLAQLLDPTDRIAADGANLIVRAAPERLAQIKSLVVQLDAKPHNLMITVLQSQNVSAEQLNANAELYLNVPLNKPSATSGAIHGELNAYREHGVAGSTQQLRTLEGQAAYIKAGIAQPVQSIAVYGSGYPAMVNTTTTIEATTGFAVTPRLNGDEVMLSVSPWAERMRNNGAIDMQSATTNVRAKLGEWVEIGSVQEQSQSSNVGLSASHSGGRSSELRILVKVDAID